MSPEPLTPPPPVTSELPPASGVTDPSPASPPAPTRRWGWALLLPPLVALAVHAGNLRADFMGDDAFLILSNPQITRPGPLSKLLLTDWFNRNAREAIGYYRPLVKASFRATYAWFGANPTAFHAGNILLHALATLMLALVLRRLVPLGAAVAGACLFAAHPDTVQAVGNITARSDVLSAALALACCAAFAEWLLTRRALWMGLGLLACALALGSKESVLLLPVFLVLLGLSMGQPLRRVAGSVLPFLAVLAAYLGLRRAVGISPIPSPLAQLSWGGRALAALKALGAYVGPLLFARDIVLLPRQPTSALDPLVLLGLATVVVGIAVLAWTRLRGALAFGVALLGGGLAPALAIWVIHIPMWKDDVPISERWLYLPAAGLGIIVAALVARLPGRARWLIAPLLLALGAVSVLRVPVYATDLAYARYSLAVMREVDPSELSPRERRLRWSYEGEELGREGRWEEALAAYEQAAREAPWMPDSWQALATVYAQLNRPEGVVRVLEHLFSRDFATRPEAIEQRRSYGDDSFYRMDRVPLYLLLGRGYAAVGRFDDARRTLEHAVKVAAGRPEEPELLDTLGHVLEQQGQQAAARSAYQRAQALRPEWDEAARDLARLQAAPEVAPVPPPTPAKP